MSISKAKKAKMKEVIERLYKDGIYPSASKVSRGLGRSTHTMNNEELNVRREIFKELGIKVKQRGWTAKEF